MLICIVLLMLIVIILCLIICNKEKYANIKLEKIRNRDSDNKNLLNNTVKLLNYLKIPFVIDYGTLLGAIREGKPIAGDQDLDISIPLSYKGTLIKYNNELFNKFDLHKQRDIKQNVSFKHLISFILNENELKKYSIEKLHGNVLYMDIYLKDFFPLYTKKINFLNYIVNIPEYSEDYLTECYGNWKIPSGKSGNGNIIFKNSIILNNENQDYIDIIPNKGELNDLIKFKLNKPCFCQNNKINIPDKNSILFNIKKNDIVRVINICKLKPYKYILFLQVLCLHEPIKWKDYDNIPNNITIFSTHIPREMNKKPLENKKIIPFPLGRDFRSINNFYDSTIQQKTILCYSNFSLNTHNERKQVWEKIKNKNFITKKMPKGYLNYNISRDEFANDIQKSKFVICPRGGGTDTYRFYDSIRCGAIPIVIKEHFHDMFLKSDIIVYYLNNVDEFNYLTENKLNEFYEKNKYKINRFPKELNLHYWKDILNNM